MRMRSMFQVPAMNLSHNTSDGKTHDVSPVESATYSGVVCSCGASDGRAKSPSK